MQNTSIINCISEHLRECVIHDSFVACIVLDWKTAHNIKYYLLIDTITRTLGCHAVPSLQRLWVSVGMGLQVLLAQPKDPAAARYMQCCGMAALCLSARCTSQGES
jgi:hypothetical protein